MIMYISEFEFIIDLNYMTKSVQENFVYIGLKVTYIIMYLSSQNKYTITKILIVPL